VFVIIVAASSYKHDYSRMAAPQQLRAANVPALPLLFAPSLRQRNQTRRASLFERHHMEAAMGFGRGALLWLLGVPLPIILILALFMHH
jgi:hypothetical protein